MLKAFRLAASTRAKGIAAVADSCTAIWGDNREILVDFPAESVHCTISSPPYGDQKNYGSPDEIGSGNTDHLGYLSDLRHILEQLYRITVPGGAVWLVLDTLKRDGKSIPLPLEAIHLAGDCGWVFQECVIWDKGKSLPWSHRGHFRGVFEYILLLSKGRLRHFDLDAVRDTDHLSAYWVKYPERFNALGKAPSDLWHFPIPVQGSWGKSDLRHLCPFPNDLVRRMIAVTTLPGDVVLDPFAGTCVVPAMASIMGRLGVGIELSHRYFDAFVQTGYARISKEERTSARRLSAEQGASIAELINQLRTLKYPKSLFSAISRADRLGEPARSMIAAFVVDATTDLGESTERPHIKVEVLATSGTKTSELQQAISSATRIAPLSKFGLDADVLVLSPRKWLADEFHPENRGVTWHQYDAGRFNAYSAALTPAAFRRALRSLASDATRIPPIFSKLGVRIAPAIPD